MEPNHKKEINDLYNLIKLEKVSVNGKRTIFQIIKIFLYVIGITHIFFCSHPKIPHFDGKEYRKKMEIFMHDGNLKE